MNTNRMSARLRFVAMLLLWTAGPGALPALPQDRPDGPLISMQLRDTDVRDALRMVAQQGEVNIVLSNRVEGSVTLELQDATLGQTLDAIMSVSGLQYANDGSIITVSTLDELLEQRKKRLEFAQSTQVDNPPEPIPETRLFHLKHVDAERMQSVVENMLSGIGKVAILKTSDHVAQDVGADQTPAGSETDLQIGSQLATTSMGQPARSHTLVVVDVAERLDQVSRVISEIDVKPMQVLIEARFVEVALGQDDKLGIDWNVVVKAAGSEAPHTFPFGNSTLGDFNPNVSGGSPGGVFPAAPSVVSGPGARGLFTFGTLDFSEFTAVLRMIEDDSRIQVVSNPRVLVKDRATATILVGERYPILSATITDEGTVTEQLDHYEPIGVQLEVTPSVLSDNDVELIVRPSTSSLGPLVQGSTGITVARINTRQIDTSVSVQDSQTVVLGGLISTRASSEERSVPFLGDIPFLGALFTHEATETTRIDLVVFLTISVLSDHGLTDSQQQVFDRTTLDLSNPVLQVDPTWYRKLDFISSGTKD